LISHIKSKHPGKVVPSSPEKSERVLPAAPRLFECTFCGKFLSRKNRLENHIKAIHLKKDNPEPSNIKEVPSSQANKPAVSSYSLNGSNPEAGAPRRFECMFCGKFLSRNDKLEKHIDTIHMKEGEFKPGPEPVMKEKKGLWRSRRSRPRRRGGSATGLPPLLVRTATPSSAGPTNSNTTLSIDIPANKCQSESVRRPLRLIVLLRRW